MSDTLTTQQRKFLTEVLGIALHDTGVPAGLVEKRKFLLTRWTQVGTDFDNELSSLCSAIQTQVPVENADEIRAGVTAALKPVLDEIRSDIQDAVDQSVNAGDGDYAAVRNAVKSSRNRLQGNALIAALRDSSLTPGQKFETALYDALGEIQDRLTA